MNQEVEDVFGIICRNTPTQHVEVGLKVVDQREVLRLGFGIQVHRHADLRQHPDSRLTDRLIVDIAVVRAIQLDREAVAVTCFFHQRLGCFDISDRGAVHRLVPAVHEGRCDHTGRRRLTAHDDLLDRIAVDRHRHGLAHTHIGQRVGAFDIVIGQIRIAHVHPEKDHAVLRCGAHIQTIGGGNTLKVLHRHVLNEVDLTRQESRHAGRGVLDGGVFDARHIHGEFVLAPVVFIHFKNGAHIRFAADQLVRAGAVGILGGKGVFAPFIVLHLHGVVRLGPTFVHHEHVGQVAGHDRVGAVSDDLNGIFVRCPHLRNRGQQFLVIAVRRHRTVQRKDNVLAVELCPVMERHTFAQFEDPDIGIFFRRTPFRGQRRHDGTGHVTHHQRLHDLVRQGRCRAFVLRMRVQRQRITGAGPFQCLGLNSRRDKGNGRCRTKECSEHVYVLPVYVFV